MKTETTAKLTYVTPRMQTLCLSVAPSLLSGSTTGIVGDGQGSGLDYGGSGSDGEYGD